MDAEELAEDSSDEDVHQRSGAPPPTSTRRVTHSFAGFRANPTLAPTEHVSPPAFGAGQVMEQPTSFVVSHQDAAESAVSCCKG